MIAELLRRSIYDCAPEGRNYLQMQGRYFVAVQFRRSPLDGTGNIRLLEKLRDCPHDGLLLIFAQFGEDGQGQHFAGGAFGFGEGACSVA